MALRNSDHAQYKAKDIPLHLIDEPKNAERETMEEKELAELALNIAEVGLIKPLIVTPTGERFETVAGHRRLLACRIAKYDPVPCRIMVGGKVDPLAILVAENAHTESVNAVEEARFYQRLLDENCGNDVDVLCIKVRRGRGYVEDRLLLLRGYPAVVEALQARSISIAVARELNKVRDPIRLTLLLDTAVNQGASARQVMEWRKSSDMMSPIEFPAEEPNDQDVNAIPASTPFKPECLFCGDTENPHMMEFAYIHSPCKRILDRMLQRQNQPAFAEGD